MSFVVAIAVAVAFNVNLNMSKTNQTSILALANVEALALEVGNVPWYDFINNYKGTPDKIAVTTTNCNNGSVSYQGITFFSWWLYAILLCNLYSLL